MHRRSIVTVSDRVRQTLWRSGQMPLLARLRCSERREISSFTPVVRRLVSLLPYLYARKSCLSRVEAYRANEGYPLDASSIELSVISPSSSIGRE